MHLYQLLNQEVKVTYRKIKAGITPSSCSTGLCQSLFVCHLDLSEKTVTCIGRTSAFKTHQRVEKWVWVCSAFEKVKPSVSWALMLLCCSTCFTFRTYIVFYSIRVACLFPHCIGSIKQRTTVWRRLWWTPQRLHSLCKNKVINNQESSGGMLQRGIPKKCGLRCQLQSWLEGRWLFTTALVCSCPPVWPLASSRIHACLQLASVVDAHWAMQIVLQHEFDLLL